MNEQFQKFKKRIWRDIIIKCALSAAAVAVLIVNAVLLPCLLCGIKLFWAWYLLVAFGGLCVGGGIAFLFLRTNDKKIAVRLDNELQLNERIQTALLYQNKEGDMFDLQREDTAAAIRSTRRIAFCNLALTIVLAVLLFLGVCALPVVAVYAYPDEPETQEPVDPPFEETDWHRAALNDLIKYVEDSQKADANAKEGMLRELKGLRTLIDEASGIISKVFVENTVSNIRNAVTEANGQAGVTEEQKALNNEERDYVENKLYEIYELQPSGSEWEWEELDELIAYVEDSQKLDATAKEGIVSELRGLRESLVEESVAVSTLVENTASNIRGAVTEANAQGVTEEQKALNNEECDYVVKRLHEIFANDPTTNPDDPPKKPGNNTGTGELIVGGVPFFDPEKGYVSSGDPEVREKYYGEIQKAMLEGTISREEWEEIVATYFADLRDKEENKEV